MISVDTPKAAVRLAFVEAAQDCIVARIRHSYSPDCTQGLDCGTCQMLVWAQGVFASWWHPGIGADDLAAALWILRGTT